MTEDLKPLDHRQRRKFVVWVVKNKAVDNDSRKKIIFTDKSDFQFNGYVNKQNCRIWGNENLRQIHKQAKASSTGT